MPKRICILSIFLFSITALRADLVLEQQMSDSNQTVTEAVACHHHPRRCGTEEICLAGVVHIANALHHSQAAYPEIVPSPVDTDYLKFAGLENQFATWRKELSESGGDRTAESAC